jgi:hypothetical protein
MLGTLVQIFVVSYVLLRLPRWLESMPRLPWMPRWVSSMFGPPGRAGTPAVSHGQGSRWPQRCVAGLRSVLHELQVLCTVVGACAISLGLLTWIFWAMLFPTGWNGAILDICRQWQHLL